MMLNNNETLINRYKMEQLPRVSEFNREYEEPLQGAKMTVMAILEFRDINGPAPMD